MAEKSYIDGTLRPLAVESNSTGPAGTPSATVESVQGVVGGTPISVDNKKATYHYEGSYTPYATATDMISIGGSASKTIKITQFSIRATATATSSLVLYWVKRSTANTGGTPTSRTPIALDSLNAAPTGTITEYAAAPTTGTSVGNLLVLQTNCGVLLNNDPTNRGLLATAGTQLSQPFPGSPIQFPTLRGTGEMLCLNYNGAAIPAGLTFLYTIEWTEE